VGTLAKTVESPNVAACAFHDGQKKTALVARITEAIVRRKSFIVIDRMIETRRYHYPTMIAYESRVGA
jgi:hypothetical protein